MSFCQVPFPEVRPDFVRSLQEDWMLLSAGTAEELGTMTVSWGLTGFIWGTDTVMVMVRKSRNTLRYLLEQPFFSLCSFPPEFHDKLYYCGRHSGRDVNKVQVCGFSPAQELGAPYFKEASTVYICRKLYSGTIDPTSFSDRELFHTWYETGVHAGDNHRFFVGQVARVLKNNG